jgi:hypothetical protein
MHLYIEELVWYSCIDFIRSDFLQVVRNMALLLLFNHTHTFIAANSALIETAFATVMGLGNAGNRVYTTQ